MQLETVFIIGSGQTLVSTSTPSTPNPKHIRRVWALGDNAIRDSLCWRDAHATGAHARSREGGGRRKEGGGREGEKEREREKLCLSRYGLAKDTYRGSASKPRGNTVQGFKDFFLKAKARIWAWLSYMCHICSTAIRVEGRTQKVLGFADASWFRGSDYGFGVSGVIVSLGGGGESPWVVLKLADR